MSAWICRHSDGKADPKIVPPHPRIPYKGLGADSGEKRQPVGDIDTAAVDGLKRLTQTGRLEKRTWLPLCRFGGGRYDALRAWGRA
jgi:hypothetical protein